MVHMHNHITVKKTNSVSGRVKEECKHMLITHPNLHAKHIGSCV